MYLYTYRYSNEIGKKSNCLSVDKYDFIFSKYLFKLS